VRPGKKRWGKVWISEKGQTVAEKKRQRGCNVKVKFKEGKEHHKEKVAEQKVLGDKEKKEDEAGDRCGEKGGPP